MTKIPHSKIKISLAFAVTIEGYSSFETVTKIGRLINQDVFVDNMKRNSDLQNTWSSCVKQMLKWQTRVKGTVSVKIYNILYAHVEPSFMT